MDEQMREPANVGLVMNFARDVSQRVAALNMDIHGGGAHMHAHSASWCATPSSGGISQGIPCGA